MSHTLVMLPGMDGTGNLFSPLLKRLPLSLNIKVITFSNHKKQNYDELVSEIKLQLPSVPFVLIAESFSGVLAHRISLDDSIPLKKLILIATFLESPRPMLLSVARFLPLSIIFLIPLPASIYQFFCFSDETDPDRVEILKESLSQVEVRVLANRLRLIAKLNLSSKSSKVKTLILNPANDRLLPSRVSARIQTKFPNSEVKKVDGSHFLAQTNPKEVAMLIQEFIQNTRVR